MHKLIRNVCHGSAIVLVVLACSACGGGGGGGGGGGSAARNDLYINDLTNMTGDGGVMVHFAVAWTSTAGQPATNVGYRLRRTNGAIAGSGTIPSIRSRGTAHVMVHARGFGDQEKLTIEVDPGNTVAEDEEANNSVIITALQAPLPEPSDGVDLRFNDCHYHQAYYYQNTEFHFFVVNPTNDGIDATNVPYSIYDNGFRIHTGVIGRVPAPTAGNPFPSVEIYLSSADLYGSDPARRPTAGIHRYSVQLDPENTIAETDEANNCFSITVDVPEGRTLPQVPGDVVDIRHQDPHFHQYPAEGKAVFHFFISNYYNGGGERPVKWRIVREDGALIDEGEPDVQALQFHEHSFSHFDDTDGEVHYRLILDPDNEIAESDETNNVVPFIIDWSPYAWG